MKNSTFEEQVKLYQALRSRAAALRVELFSERRRCQLLDAVGEYLLDTELEDELGDVTGRAAQLAEKIADHVAREGAGLEKKKPTERELLMFIGDQLSEDFEAWECESHVHPTLRVVWRGAEFTIVTVDAA